MPDPITARDDHLRAAEHWYRKARESEDRTYAARAVRVAMIHWRMAGLFARAGKERKAA